MLTGTQEDLEPQSDAVPEFHKPYYYIDKPPSALIERTLADFKAVSAYIEEAVTLVMADVEAIMKALDELHVTVLGQAVEGAMDETEIRRAVEVYEKLKKIYGAKFVCLGGTEGVLENLKAYLVSQCADESVLGSQERRRFKKGDKPEIQLAKSALRALLDPAPDSRWGNYLHNAAADKGISAKDKIIPFREMLAFYWLAATDPHMPLLPELEVKRAQCLDEEKKHVLYSLADIRRAHNRRGDYREKEDFIDEPSCPPGTAGRMGMHLHSLHTLYERHISPVKQYHRKMHAYIIDDFKSLPVTQQFTIMQALNRRIQGEETKASTRDFFTYIAAIMTDEKCKAFRWRLAQEFAGYGNTEEQIACLYFANAVMKMIYRFDQDLYQRFEQVTFESLIRDIKIQVETSLKDIAVLDEKREALADILGKIEVLRLKMQNLARIQPQTLSDWDALQREIEKLQREYYQLHEEKDEHLSSIQRIASSAFLARFDILYSQYTETSLNDNQRLTPDDVMKIPFEPFWLKKFKASFTKSEGLCKFSCLNMLRQNQLIRKRLVLNLFTENLSSSPLMGELRENLGMLRSILDACQLQRSDTKAREIMTEIPRVEVLDNALRRALSQQIFTFSLTLSEGFSGQDRAFLDQVITDPLYLERLHMKESEQMQFVLGLCRELKRAECLLGATRLLPKPATLSTTQAAAASSSSSSSASSSHGLKSGIKKLARALTKKLTISEGTTPVFPEGEDESGAIQQLYRQSYAVYESKTETESRLYSGTALTKQEIALAQGYLNTPSHAQKVFAGEVYRPQTVAQITGEHERDAEVSLVNYYNGGSVQKVYLPFADLKQYASMHDKEEGDLTHPAEILSRSYGDEVVNNTNVNLIVMFFAELNNALKEDGTFFEMALQRQTTLDLHAMLQTLETVEGIQNRPQLQAKMGEALAKRPERYLKSQSQQSQSAWEEEMIPFWQKEMMVHLQKNTFVMRPV